MKKIYFIGVFLMLLTSCMSSKKYATFVDSRPERALIVKTIPPTWLTIVSDKSSPTETIYDQKKKSFVPAILYWGWNSTIDCELDVNTRIDYVKRGIYKGANYRDLQQYLSDGTLEINLKEVPGRFLYEHKGNTIIMIFAFVMNGVEAISPYQIDLVYEYNIKRNGKTEMSGRGRIKNEEQPQRNGASTTKKFTWEYLDEFKKETERMGIEVVSEIIEDLKRRN